MVLDNVLQWIATYGYAGIFFLLILGIVGLPVPDETLMTYTGFLVYKGTLNFAPALAAAYFGSVAGITISYWLGRKLGLPSTGNADGNYNLRLISTAASGSFKAMLAMLATGLIVTQLQGGKTDPASGNWTRAVRGLWVEGGEIVHAVHDVTLAGTMDAMLNGIRAVGHDVERLGAIRTGSILIDDMQVGGRA